MCEGLLAKATKLESQVSYPHVVFASQEPLRTVCLFSELLAKRNSSEEAWPRRGAKTHEADGPTWPLRLVRFPAPSEQSALQDKPAQILFL